MDIPENTNDKEEACKDDHDKDNNKERMKDPQLLPLLAERLQDTAIG